jgi:hypothetical protein
VDLPAQFDERRSMLDDRELCPPLRFGDPFRDFAQAAAPRCLLAGPRNR